MNKLYIGQSSCVRINTETEKITEVFGERDCIRKIILAKEPTEIIYNYCETSYTTNAEAGDLIIIFYNECFNKPVVVVKSEDWRKNIEDYNEQLQREKEAWAAKQKEAKTYEKDITAEENNKGC